MTIVAMSPPFFHSLFLHLLPDLQHPHSPCQRNTHHREGDEEGGILSLFLTDSGHHTGQAPGTQRLLTQDTQSCSRLSDPTPRPQDCVLQAYPNPQRPWPVQCSAVSMVLHLHFTFRGHRKRQPAGFSSHKWSPKLKIPHPITPQLTVQQPVSQLTTYRTSSQPHPATLSSSTTKTRSWQHSLQASEDHLSFKREERRSHPGTTLIG